MKRRGLSPLGVAVLGASLLAVSLLGWNGAVSQAEEDAKLPSSASPQPLPPTPEIVSLSIEGDRAVEVVLGPEDNPNVIVYMHGVCGDPLAFRAWAGAAAQVATLVSLRGDDPCAKRRGRTKWSWDAPRIDRRIQRAVRAVDELRRERSPKAVPSSADDVVLVGYSQGAYRAELLASRYPSRYRRVALIAHPKEPQASWLGKAERVLLVAGERDIRQPMRDARDQLKRLGREVIYRELPEARHGEYGPRAAEIMGPSLSWLLSGAQPAAAAGQSEDIP